MHMKSTTTITIRKRDFAELLAKAGYKVGSNVSLHFHPSPTGMRGEPEGYGESSPVITVSWDNEAG